MRKIPPLLARVASSALEMKDRGYDDETMVTISGTIAEFVEVAIFATAYERTTLKGYIADMLKEGWTTYNEIEQRTGVDIMTIRQIIYKLSQEYDIEKAPIPKDGRRKMMRICH